MSSPLAGVAAMNAIGFGVYGNVTRRLNNPESLPSVGIAGMCAGLVMVIKIFQTTKQLSLNVGNAIKNDIRKIRFLVEQQQNFLF